MWWRSSLCRSLARALTTRDVSSSTTAFHRSTHATASSSSTTLVAAAVSALVMTAFAANHTSSSTCHAEQSPQSSVHPPPNEKINLTRRFTRRNHQKYHRYVIIGCGTAAYAAIEGIRQMDAYADILILSDERALPRVENQLSTSPDTLSTTLPIDTVPIQSEALTTTYNEWRRHIAQTIEEETADPTSTPLRPVTMLMPPGTTLSFDVERNRLVLSNGTEIIYHQCLIACSGHPKHFYVLDSHRISYSLKDRMNSCTTLHEFEMLDKLSTRPEIQRVSIVGGGLLGTEVATALATDPRNQHLQIQLLFTESAPEQRLLPRYLAQEISMRLENVGVQVVPDCLVTSIKCEGASVQSAGVTITALGPKSEKHKMGSDYIVLASTQTRPNFRFDPTRPICFEVDKKTGGIVVNAQLQAAAGVFVAGNAASYYDVHLGRRRVDRYDHAVNSGLLAGRNMVAAVSTVPVNTGMKPRIQLYRHQPLFRSSLQGIDVLMEGIGELDASFQTVGVWVQPIGKKGSYERGVVYYLKGNKVMGVLLWNASDVLESARQLMLSGLEVHGKVVEELKTKISLGPEEWLHVETT